MALKDCSDEFKADAVALYESTTGATDKSIAADLGINRATLRVWVLRDRERCGVTAAPARPPARAGSSRVRGSGRADPPFGGEGDGTRSRASAGSRPSGTSCARHQVIRRRDELVISRFQFVDDHRAIFEVKRLCQVPDVNRSSYYGAGARAARQRVDLVLAAKIREFHSESGVAYDSPQGDRRTPRERDMRSTRSRSPGSCGRTPSPGSVRRRVRTTVPDPAAGTVPDLFDRDFTATEPGLKLMGDITYLPLAGGTFLCLATVLDCFSRKIVGSSSADHMRTDLSPTRSGWPLAPAAHRTGRSFTPITEPSTDPGPAPASATSSEAPGRWARSAPAPTTPSAKASTPR